MGDHDRGAVPHRLGEPRPDQRLGRRVDRGRGVVEDQDPRIDHECPGDREPLALAAGERDPALADHRVVAVGELLDEVMRLRCARGGLDELLRHVGHAEGDVVADARREEERILRDDADLAAQRAPSHVAHVDAVDQHASLPRVVEARHERREGRLAGTGSADQRDRAAGLDLEVDLGQHGSTGVVAETDPFEHDPPRA